MRPRRARSMSRDSRPPQEEYFVGLRLRPTDTSFYDLFTTSAQHIVTGAGLLAEMITRRAPTARTSRKRMREAEHVCDENTHAIVRRVNSSFVTPFDREDIYSLASGLDDVMDDMDEVVDLILLYEVVTLPDRVPRRQVEVIQRCAEITAERDARAADDDRPRRVLDRDQPAGERRRQELPPYPRQALQRRLQGDRGAQAQGHRRARSRAPSTPSRRSPTSWSRSPSRSPEACGPRDRHHGRRRRPRSSTTPTASTTRPTPSPPRSRRGR